MGKAFQLLAIEKGRTQLQGQCRTSISRVGASGEVHRFGMHCAGMLRGQLQQSQWLQMCRSMLIQGLHIAPRTPAAAGAPCPPPPPLRSPGMPAQRPRRRPPPRCACSAWDRCEAWKTKWKNAESEQTAFGESPPPRKRPYCPRILQHKKILHVHPMHFCLPESRFSSCSDPWVKRGPGTTQRQIRPRIQLAFTNLPEAQTTSCSRAGWHFEP